MTIVELVLLISLTPNYVQSMSGAVAGPGAMNAHIDKHLTSGSG
jgi:hypothetical protein